ncbi:unnamed protein product [Effrenium voratum]|nr:unnamed protein product [Effrenium voratum]
MAAMVAVGPSPLGGEGVFAQRDFAPGEQVFAEPPAAWLAGMCRLMHRDNEGLKDRFDQLAALRHGAALAALRSAGLFRGSGAVGQERRAAFERWAADTWPEEQAAHQAAMADAMTVLAYNSYSSKGNENQLVFPMLSKVNHSCAGNVSTIAEEEGGQLICRRPISLGEELFTSYLTDFDLLRPVPHRQRVLREKWDFDCACPRCKSNEDDTRRFSCRGLGRPPSWQESEEEPAAQLSPCTGSRAAACSGQRVLPCDICGAGAAGAADAADAEAPSAWLRREEEGEQLLEAMPEGMYAAWAKMEEFSTAHPLHGLSGRWKLHLVSHTEQELAADEDEDLSELLTQYRAEHQRCLEAILGLDSVRDRASQKRHDDSQETMIVTIPEGSRPGDELTITTGDGQEITVTVPEGAVPGEDLEIPVPKVATKDSKPSVMSVDADGELSALGGYPALSADPPIATSYQLSKPSGMPSVSEGGPDAPEPEDVAAARQEVEAELRARQTAMDAVGRGGGSAVSTPETQLGIKKDRDFVRRNLPMNLQQQYLRRVSTLQDIVNRSIKVPQSRHGLYTEDLRVRAATIRMSCGMEPPHFRMALEESAKSGARWSQMFRPGFNDIVNETFKVGANACIFSKTYLTNKLEREQFLRMHVKDSNGILWFELQRSLESIYYQRMDFVDVQMYHPQAWGFPDSAKIVTPNPGEPIDPFHGWCAQKSMDSVTEMEDVDFLYTLRLRCLPESTFQALSLGKIPAFIQQCARIQELCQTS